MVRPELWATIENAGCRIGQGAKELVEKRDRRLNQEGADEVTLKKWTLTNLYKSDRRALIGHIRS